MSKESIKVLCRIRPVNQREKDSGFKTCIACCDQTVKISVNVKLIKIEGDKETADYTYDKVFGPDAHQVEIFENAAKPIIQGAMDGYNGTLLCYGQTSSGKTFTMEVIMFNLGNT
jgi:kinesin family protein 5